jgi:hypothetical protein
LCCHTLWIINTINHSDGFVRQVASSFSGAGGQSSNSGPFSGAGGGFSSATDKPQESANDEALPTDCGRDPEKGNGLLCFPVGKLCAESKPNYPCTKLKVFVLSMF